MTYVDVREVVAALHIAAASAKVSRKRIMAVAGALHHREICALLKAFVPTSNVPTLVEGDAEDGSSLAEAPVPSAQYDVSEAKVNHSTTHIYIASFMVLFIFSKER